ncbi:MAG: hypothetical protein ACYTER_04895 [Planctomycetota bacterium]|jgi:hypothetical protein
MNNTQHNVLALLLLAVTAVNGWAGSDFAVEVVDYQGNYSATTLYNDPNAILGKPATQCRNKSIGPFEMPLTFRVKIVEAAYYKTLDDTPTVTTIEPDSYVTVKFDHKVADYSGNPFGQDFIVFGNAFFQHSSLLQVSDATDMNVMALSSPAGASIGEVYVSVSQDGQHWYRFDSGPWGDDLYPTQAYQWDRDNAEWTGNEMDFTRPVDPNLGMEAFNGLSVADAIDLYDGSGGGTPFDLKDLADYDELAVDPNTGCRWIQYVRLEGGEGLYALGGEVDAVADVAVCGDPTHPYPAGDITKDCRVDLEDFAILSGSWLECTYQCD